MKTLTAPKDLIKPVSQAKEIIQLIETEFKKNPKLHKHNNSAYYILTLKNAVFSSDDIREVIARYKKMGWVMIESYREYENRGGEKIINTKFRFFEMY